MKEGGFVKDNYAITKTQRGEILIDLHPGIDLSQGRHEVKTLLDESVKNKHIVGYDAAFYGSGRIVLYYNALIDQNGEAAERIARALVKKVFKED